MFYEYCLVDVYNFFMNVSFCAHFSKCPKTSFMLFAFFLLLDFTLLLSIYFFFEQHETLRTLDCVVYIYQKFQRKIPNLDIYEKSQNFI